MNDIPPDSHKAWAIHLRNLVGGEVSVNVYYDESEENSIPIFTSTSNEGVLCATVGIWKFIKAKIQICK